MLADDGLSSVRYAYLRTVRPDNVSLKPVQLHMRLLIDQQSVVGVCEGLITMRWSPATPIVSIQSLDAFFRTPGLLSLSTPAQL